jgi:NADPH2:quinone reductase
MRTHLRDLIMKYIDLPKFGAPEVLALAEGDTPSVNHHDILINVEAAGVNRPDIIQRQGLYPPPPDASPILGLEVAGTIITLGKDVKNWKLGDKVCALTNGGGYAEQVSVPADQCLPIPEGLSMVEAAALPETFFYCVE